MKYQSEAEERFQKSEEQCWKRETEMEERRRRDERDHEMRLFPDVGTDDITERASPRQLR